MKNCLLWKAEAKHILKINILLETVAAKFRFEIGQ